MARAWMPSPPLPTAAGALPGPVTRLSCGTNGCSDVAMAGIVRSVDVPAVRVTQLPLL